MDYLKSDMNYPKSESDIHKTILWSCVLGDVGGFTWFYVSNLHVSIYIYIFLFGCATATATTLAGGL